MDSQALIEFEESIATAFNNAEIPHPIHLSKGNEFPLIEIFKDFKKGDYLFNSWRSHYHALLAGIPPEEVRRQIMTGRSMTICSLEHRMFCSAIVAGIIPIAVGVAWQIKRTGGSERVWLFIGDMTSQTGIAYECIKYARLNNLPLVVVIEDNGKSVCSDTAETWGGYYNTQGLADYSYKWDLSAHYPHSGAGKRIQF